MSELAISPQSQLVYLVHIGESSLSEGPYAATLNDLLATNREREREVVHLGWYDDWSLFAPEECLLVLLDLTGIESGLEDLLSRARGHFPHSALLVGDPDGSRGVEALTLGADEVIQEASVAEMALRIESALARYVRRTDESVLQKTLNAQLESMADRVQRDTLTGLYTRSAFLAEVDRALARARRRESMLAVVYFDLDGFKAVNDQYGHEAGDRVLRWFAEALFQKFRVEDCIGRMGGDEFVLLLEDVDNPMDAYGSAMKIRRLFNGALPLEDITLPLDASIGISMYPKSADTQALISHADMAMYAAKKRPEEGKIRFFDARLEAQLIAREGCRLRLQGKLNRADCQFALQPLYSYSKAGMHAVEALFRWPHSESTEEVVLFAEQNGMAQALDMLMLERAIEAFMDLRTRSRQFEKLHVNVSALSLDRTYYEHAARLVQKHGLYMGQLCIEVTETALAGDYRQLAKDLLDFRKIGVQLALDDFGTGYASLSYLRDLSFTAMKLDRSLVSRICEDHTSRVLCQASIDMAHSLDIEVTGEGVETSDQFGLLREMGCDNAQGYYLAMPVPPEELVDSGTLEFVF